MANHSSILAWRIPWMEEPGGLQSIESQSQIRLKWLSMQAHSRKTESAYWEHWYFGFGKRKRSSKSSHRRGRWIKKEHWNPLENKFSGRQAVKINDSETPSKSKDWEMLIRFVSWEITGVHSKRCSRGMMRTETRFHCGNKWKQRGWHRLRRFTVQEAWQWRGEET